MDTLPKRVGRVLVLGAGAVAGTATGWGLFVRIPSDSPSILGVLLAVATALLFLRLAARIADSVLGAYDTAEVRVEGPIARDGGESIPTNPRQIPAGAVVDQIERADSDRNVEALIVRVNTPGGEIVPSDDIRRAVADFEGPTVAYATDVCASGGYWIASACDHVVARENSLVGSIGVRGSTLNAADLADHLGVGYERFVAGEYKDAGTPLRELREDERYYLQGLVDDLYESFVQQVATARDLSIGAVKDTEARVYVGRDAAERGLVDELGTRDDVEAHLETVLGHEVAVRELEPPRGLLVRARRTAAAAAYAFGAGVGSVFGDGDGTNLEFR
jgi:protease-4